MELSRKPESEIPEKENRSLSLNNEPSIWPCCKADAESQRDLLTRYMQDAGKSQLPVLGDLKLNNDSLALKKPDDKPGDSARTDATKSDAAAGRPLDATRVKETVPAALDAKQEKVNTNGSRLAINSDGSVSKLTRTDGSVVDVSYDAKGEKKQIVDTNKDGNARTLWNLNANGLWEAQSQIKDQTGAWTSDGKHDSKLYRDVLIDGQGITTAIDQVGFRHVTTADGSKLKEGAIYTFDEKGRVNSISYSPDSNRILKIGYDENNKINKVEVRDAEGKLQQTKTRSGENEWKITNRDGSAAGTWQGDMQLTKDGCFKQQDAKDKAAGQWQITTPFEKFTERVSPDGKQIARVFNDKSEFQYEVTASGTERITKVTRGNDSREFRYDADGKLAQLVEVTQNGTQILKPEAGQNVKVGSGGELSITKADGSKILKKVDFSTEEQDKDGNTLKVVTRDAKSRTFEYETINNHKQLVKITDIRPGKTGETSEVWTAKKNGDGSLSGQFVSAGAGGKERVLTGVEVLTNGDYKFKSSDGKERLARLAGDNLANREGGFSATVDDARERLKAALESQLDAPRKARLEGFMRELEKRASDAVERQTVAGISKDASTEKWEKKIAKTYDQLAQMMEENPSTAVYPPAMRAKLIENFMWIAGDTTRGAQDVGNCWEMSGRNLTGMQNNPDAMARMLKEVSLTGTFTAVHGGIKSKDSLDRRKGDLEAPRKFTIPKNMLTLDAVNANWSLNKPTEPYWRGGTGTMPSTPVGYILDNVLGYMGGRTSHNALDGGLWESFNSPSNHTREGWYYGINELMYMATGEKTSKPVRISSNDIGDGDISNLTNKRLQRQLLEHGGALLVGPGHMFAVKLIKKNDSWQIVTDNQWSTSSDMVIGKVSDLRNWNVQRTRVKYQSDRPQTV